MEIRKTQITIADLTEGYKNNDEEGVVGYYGRLDIRPPYQREFVYPDKKRDLVIDTVLKGFPLNTMYWNTKDDGSFEVLDGQQRTISICEYVAKNFVYEEKYFHNHYDDIQEKFLAYKLDVYQCKGTDSERIEWFRIINVAGEVLTNQEILNATYVGPWLADAKRRFSKTGCVAYNIGQDYMDGAPIRQAYLETVLRWINDGNIKEYMGKHQYDENADELWDYYQSVIDWVETVFVGGDKTNIIKPMKGVAWGELYNQFSDKKLDPEAIRAEVARLLEDDEVHSQKGIYAYVLDSVEDRDERHLNLRTFKPNQKTTVYKRQGGICANKNNCPKKGEPCDLKEMEADHITPWAEGGKTELDNCQMLCRDCHKKKTRLQVRRA